MSESSFLEPAWSDEEYYERLASLSEEKGPTVFNLRCQLPVKGRADMPAAATDMLGIVLKAYASGGENTLHAHHSDDHAFIILQGSATFYGEGEKLIATVGKLQGIMISHGALYRFEAGVEEPLVLLRVSAQLAGSLRGMGHRKSADGSQNAAHSAKNKTVELVLSPELTFG